VVPFPKALSLKQGSVGLFEALKPEPKGPEHDRVWYIDADRLRAGSVAKEPVPVGRVIFPAFEAGSQTRVEPLTNGEALLGLFGNTVNIRSHKEAGLDWLLTIVTRAKAYRLVFSDLHDACTAIVKVASAHAPGGRDVESTGIIQTP